MKYKIVNIRKFITSILTVLGIIIFLSILFSQQSFSHGDTNYKTIRISSGDTLWSIASSESISNGYYENQDVRTIIDNIRYINNLKTSSLHVGQELLVISDI